MNAVYRSTKTLLADNIRLLFVGLATLALLWNFLVYYHPIENMSTGVLVWWTGLYSVSVLNICGWRQSAAALARGKDEAQPAVYLFRWRQLLLSAAFVLGCGFRSILPRADVQRIGLFDTWVSNVMLGRSVATVAELCFAAQWALLLYKLAKPGHVRTAL